MTEGEYGVPLTIGSVHGGEQVERLLDQNSRVPCMVSRGQTAVKWGLLLGAEKRRASCPGRHRSPPQDPTATARPRLRGRDPKG